MFTRSRVVLAAALATAAQTSNTLTVTQPSSDHRCTIQRVWQLENAHEAQGLPTQFTVMLNNPNTALLSGRLALIAIEPLYEGSKTVNPGNIAAGTGYTIQLCDPFNNTNIYAETSSFEVKPKGSTYPSQSSPSTSASVTGGVSVPSGSSSATAPSDSGKGNGAESLGADGICQAVLFSVVVMLGVVHWA